MGIKMFPLNYANTTGSGLIGALVNGIFYGAAFVVAFQYARRHARSDPLYVKVIIGSMILLATLQTIFINHETYQKVITNHTDTRGLHAPVEFSLAGKFLCVYLITFIAQMFFVTRIWTLTARVSRVTRLALVPIIGFALLQITTGSAIVHLEATSATLAELASHGKWNRVLTAIQGSSTAACDVAITLTLCHLYRAHRSASSRVNSTVDRLVVYAINRAAATSLCATLAILSYFFLGGTFYFVVPTYMTGQLYVISAVSVLTSRESLRDINNKTAKDESEQGSITKFDSAAYASAEKQV
ncbi:hypothetical protein FA13DRAFT_1819855 [Coprinellus micaceus]|uniref:DUF6534 domain-containing protein n=1 Tax=Coprinellus micaceus TaxID=71717 RepID=A0A4Y7SIG4_COPMI|nr:hypothetical protein FA13DRAFT_1819855 [Coprinellus micaceus]